MLLRCGLARCRKSERGMCEVNIKTVFIGHELVDLGRQECSLTRSFSYK